MSEDYDDFRRRLEGAEARARKFTMLFTLVPVLLVVALVAVAGSRLIRVNRALGVTNTDLTKELQDREAVVKVLSAKIDGLEKERATLQSDLTSLNKKFTEQSALLEAYTTQKVTPKTVSDSHKLIIERPQIQRRIQLTLDATSDHPSVRVMLWIANEQQADPARHLQADLIKGGYIAPGIANAGKRGEKIPELTEIRFFHEADKEVAARLAAFLERQGIKTRLVLLRPTETLSPTESILPTQSLGWIEILCAQDLWRGKRAD